MNYIIFGILIGIGIAGIALFGFTNLPEKDPEPIVESITIPNKERILKAMEDFCKRNDGNWAEESKLCSGVDSVNCSLAGGEYNECDDRIVDEGIVRPSLHDGCIRTCQFIGIP